MKASSIAMSSHTTNAATAEPFCAPAQRGAAERMRHRPRLGFFGAGWLARERMRAIAQDGAAQVVAIGDGDAQKREVARASEPSAVLCESLGALLQLPVDGLVLAAPDQVHDADAQAALARGIAVFSLWPLARDAVGIRCVIDAAQRADRLLGVDLPYRRTRAMQAVRQCVAAGEIGEVFAVDLVFHRALGPDRAWLHGPQRPGGGCVSDLGAQMIDLALWVLDFAQARSVTSCLHAGGRRLVLPTEHAEDHALAQFELPGGCVVRLACSWNRPSGCDATIEARFHGTRGESVSFRNLRGSLHDFVAERLEGTRTLRLAAPPDAWEGRAAVHWVHKLAAGGRFDAQVQHLVQVAEVVDAIYGR
jgi:predicted dehydrogenase